jgi:hypothetical protein
MRKGTALDLCSHHGADLIAQPREWLYTCRSGIALRSANSIVVMTAVFVRSTRIVMVRRMANPHLAGHVGMSSARRIANRCRDRRRDQQRCNDK